MDVSEQHILGLARMSEQTNRLADVLPPEFMNGAYEESPAMPYAFMPVLAKYHKDQRPWPGTQRFVSVWFVLANGKAVGWNENPRLGWSFPVISYRNPDEPVTESQVLRFVNTHHQRYHRVLIKFGFSFSVSSELLVGFDYRHPEKPVNVMLKPVDGDLEYACLNADGTTVYGKGDYSAGEWSWISDQGADDTEALTRELHVLINVRPARMAGFRA